MTVPIQVLRAHGLALVQEQARYLFGMVDERIAVVAVAWFIGRSVALQEMRKASRLPVPTWIFYWIKYVLPAAIVVILVYGWLD